MCMFSSEKMGNGQINGERPGCVCKENGHMRGLRTGCFLASLLFGFSNVETLGKQGGKIELPKKAKMFQVN